MVRLAGSPTKKGFGGRSISIGCLPFRHCCYFFRRRKFAAKDAAQLRKAAVVPMQHAVQAVVVARKLHSLTARQQKVFA